MRCFLIDLNHVLKVRLLGREHLVPPVLHCTRFVPEYIMYAVTQGELHIENNGEALVLGEGDIFIFSKDDFHKPLKATECKYYYVHFEIDLHQVLDVTEHEYYEAFKNKRTEFLKNNIYDANCYEYLKVILKQSYHIADKGFFKYIINVFEKNRIIPGYNDAEKRFNISGAVASVLLKLENYGIEQIEKNNDKENGKTYYTVKKIVDFIDENYKSSFTGEDIEKEFFINFDYANRIFKKVMGVNIVRYRNTLRINEAKKSIRITNKTIEEISLEVGFEDKCYFSRLFKKFEGVSPGEYRKRILKDYVLKGGK